MRYELMNRQLVAALLAALILTTPLTAYGEALDAGDQKAKTPAEARDLELYQRGVSAIDAEDWNGAVKAFTQVVDAQGSRTDGALYWTAYALNRLGRKGEAMKAVTTLRRAYPKSRWLDDAEALDVEIRESRGEAVHPEAVADDELKVMAINSLMNTDPEKAYPMLEKIVRSKTASEKMKEQALFVLTQSDSARAEALIADLARGKSGEEMQRKAVKYLGINDSDRNQQVLAEIYAAPASSTALKRDILQAFMIAGDEARVLTAAKSEKDPELRAHAVEFLGVMGASAELAAMYASGASKKEREGILQALFIAGDEERLAAIARSEQDRDLRASAIRNLGLTGEESAPALLAIYASDKDQTIREAVINGLFVQGNAKALIGLSKTEKDPALKREIIRKLSVMDSDESVKYMLEILDEQ
jgi:hypothetical protein